MKVAAIGDAHLGRSYYPYTTPEGVNQRERDFEVSFEAAVDLALAQSPDLIVWLGDVFDHPRPTFRSFRIVQRALSKIREHGIAAVVISGNHDTPRLPGTGSAYSPLADTFPEFHFAHRLAYERFELPGLLVHAVPQMLTVDATKEALAEVDASRSLDRTNLLLTHPRVPQVEPKYADINEIEVDAGLLRADLVLLGHYHSHRKVLDGIWYAGATDTFSFADDPDPKGIVVLDTDTGVCTHVALSGQRPMVTPEPIYALGLSADEIQAALVDRLGAAPADAVARIYVDAVAPEAWRLVDHEAVREAGQHLLHAQIERRNAPAAGGVDASDVDFSRLGDLWVKWLKDQDLIGYDRDRILRLGDEYLARANEQAS
jgi:DNA repair exonuclease SbcCD nuclease subunit